ncbi:MAG: DUF3120 domain-containing protein [Pseudanabaena sp. ELA607]
MSFLADLPADLSSPQSSSEPTDSPAVTKTTFDQAPSPLIAPWRNVLAHSLGQESRQLFDGLVSLTWFRNISGWAKVWQMWGMALFLVSVPVFFEAPLVRFAPWLSLILTWGWLSLSRQWREDPHRRLWGDLLWGFSLTWLGGSLYWGWLRFDPTWHVPVEAVGVPWAIYALYRRYILVNFRHPWHIAYRQRYAPEDDCHIGACFYLGSLLGTAVTDGYFALVGLFPHWRALMLAETNPHLVRPILNDALAQVVTPWGLGLALGLGFVLVALGTWAMQTRSLGRWAFAGAVLGTIFVDLLFLVVALWS